MSEAVEYRPSQFNVLYKGSKESYLYNTYSTGLIKVNSDTEDKIKKVFDSPDKINMLNDKEINALSDNGFLVSSETDEIEQVKFRYFQGVYDNKQVKIVLVPTFSCNMICSYCFELTKDNSRMDEDDCEQIGLYLENELKTSNPKSFGITWYGGEPLLCIDIIEKMTSIISNVCKKLSVTRDFDEMITNGYLIDREMAARMKAANINTVQITLDGAKEDHDKTRRLCDGSGSFARIMESINIAKDFFDRVVVRLNANKGNIQGLLELIKNDPIFKEKNIAVLASGLKHYLGGKISKGEDKDCFSGDEIQKLESLVKEMKGNKGTEKHGKQLFDFHWKFNHCGGDNIKSMVIGPKGKVYKCIECVGPKDAVGDLIKGQFKPNANYLKWFQNEAFTNNVCNKCVYLPMCMGGCPVSRRRIGVPNDETCSYWRQFLTSEFAKMDDRLNPNSRQCIQANQMINVGK